MRLLRYLLPLLVATTPAVAQQTQPVYTRPSKGAAIVAIETANPANAQVVTSAVYDMTAFSEVQLDAAITQAGNTITETFNVSRIGRYIKFQATYTQYASGARLPNVVYQVLESDTASGTFNPVRGPGSWQLTLVNAIGDISNARLTMTPLPYITTQYTRPAKGNTRTVMNKLVSGLASATFPSTPAIDMRGFASVAIEARVTAQPAASPPNCRYRPQVLVYGGYTTNTLNMQLVKTPLAARRITDSVSYVVNVPASYISVAGNFQDVGSGNNCVYEIAATPLPYESSPDLYGRTFSGTNSYDLDNVTPASILTYDYLPTLRLQNFGSNAITCGAGVGNYVFALAAETATGNGGVLNLNNYAGPLYCVTTAGTSTLKVFVY